MMCATVRTLSPLGLEQRFLLEVLQHPAQEPILSSTTEEPSSELREDAEVEARVIELKAERILPVDTGAHGIGGLATPGEVLGKLHHGEECEAPGRSRALAAAREELGEVLVSKEGAEFITHLHVQVALRESGASDLGRLLGDEEVGLREEGHGSHGSGEGAVTCIISPASEFANNVYPEGPPCSCHRTAPS